MNNPDMNVINKLETLTKKPSPEFNSNMEELEYLLNVYLGDMQKEILLNIKCYYDFEGHGRSSETFEKHWLLELPEIPLYWKSLTGWRKCNTRQNRYQFFHGKTFNSVVNQAIYFLEEMIYNKG